MKKESYYSKETALKMASEALQMVKDADIDAKYGVDIFYEDDKDEGCGYYLHVFIKARDGEPEAFYPPANDLSEVCAKIEEIKERQKTKRSKEDTDLLRRMFPDSPMEDIDRLIGIVNGWKGGRDE